MSKQFLLENVSVDTVGTPVKGDGGNKSLTAWGNFGGGSISLEISDDNGANFVPLTESGGLAVSLISSSSRLINKIPMTQIIRASLIASSGASGVNVVISG